MLFNCAWSVFHTSTFYALYVYWPLKLISFCAVVGNKEVISFDMSGHQYTFVTFNIHFYEVFCTKKWHVEIMPFCLSICLSVCDNTIELSPTYEFCEHTHMSFVRIGPAAIIFYLEWVNEFIHALLIFLDWFWWNLILVMLTWCHWEVVSFMKIGPVKAILHLWV